MTRRAETGVMMMTTRKAFVQTLLVASLHGRSTAEDTIEASMTYVMSSAPNMHVAKLKADAEIKSVKSKKSAMKETMIIMVHTTTNHTKSGHWKRDTSQEASRHIPYTRSASDGQLTSCHQGLRNTMGPPIWANGLKHISSPMKLLEGLIRHGKLPASMFIIIYRDLAPQATCGVSSTLEPHAPVVHQQLSRHMRAARSRLGCSQRCSEERRVPPGVLPVLLQ
jgi:hypothetical protein